MKQICGYVVLSTIDDIDHFFGLNRFVVTLSSVLMCMLFIFEGEPGLGDRF